MKFYLIFLLLVVSNVCNGQHVAKKSKAAKMVREYKGADPYKGKPFKPNDIRTMRLNIPVGKIMISHDITYKLIADDDGNSYRADHTYRARILKAVKTGKDSSAVPASLTERFYNRVVDLTEQQIMSDQVIAPEMYYFYTVSDFNLDGKPDFAFTGELRYHAYPVKNYVWVNINGKLVYWYGLSNVQSDKENVARRMVSVIETTKKGGIYARYYNIVKDTTLVVHKVN